ncbi:MAG: hypothetical protein SH850_05455 [Planctomycetaceae bacterium]|nr:hypothetical protein [Planctomycetaceae bacterium]
MNQTGFFVANVAMTHAPHPACCSDPRVLCPKCASAALSRASHGNGLTLATRQFAEEDGLPLPVVNWTEEAAAQRQQSHIGQEPDPMTHHAAVPEVEGLPLPTYNWAEMAAENNRQRV